MRTFDVQGIEIRASRDKVFEFLRDPRNLPRWAHAFKAADSPNFADKPSSFEEARSLARSVEQARWALELHRASGPRDSALDFARKVVSALDPAHE